MPNTEDLDRCAKQLLADYDLIDLYKGFQWEGVGLPEAWERRMTVQEEVEDLVGVGGQLKILLAADTIYRWGFRKPLPAKFSEDPAFCAAVTALFVAWRQPNNVGKAEKIGTLIGVLSIKHLKIATASKFVCFVDQTRYAIYDARVSIALRKLMIDGKRAFPIVPRQVPKGRVPWPATTGNSPAMIAASYWKYLELLDRVVLLINQKRAQRELDLTMGPTQVEMALFMAGNVWRNDPE